MAYRDAPSFCRNCGAPWSRPGAVCAACGVEAVEAAPPLDDERGTARAFLSSLALYFVLLSTLLVPLAFAGEVDLAWLDRLLLIDAGLVLLWSIAHWRDIRPRLTRLGRGRDWLLAAALLPVSVGVALGNVEVMRALLGVEPIELTTAYALAGYPLWAVLLAHAVQPAIVEELAFRGVIFGAMERVMEPRTVVVVTALMFMVLHLAMLGLLFLVVMGLLLGWLRLRSGSLYPAMFLHLCHNAIVVAMDWPG